jgi:hypothetical protein
MSALITSFGLVVRSKLSGTRHTTGSDAPLSLTHSLIPKHVNFVAVAYGGLRTTLGMAHMKLALHLLAPIALLSGCSGGAFDGNWRVTAINGKAAEGREMLIEISDGHITGGLDGCNAWGRDRDHPDMIASDAAECFRNAQLEAYGRVAIPRSPPRFQRSGAVLHIRRGGDDLVAVPADSK